MFEKGYTQTYEIDYEETFDPVTKMNTVKIILSLEAHFVWEMHKFDVKNDFLHGSSEEEVYMEIPPGYGAINEGNKVCRLKKALYGLKQSPRAWFGRFTQAMVSLGYRQSQVDHTLFIKHSQNGKLTVLLVYIDDMIITGHDEIEKQTLRLRVTAQLTKDLGKLKYFLRIEVAYSRQGIFISQRKYILYLLKETKLGCKTTEVPIEQNHKIRNDEENSKVEKTQYQRLVVGKLIYLSHTRPDITYAVSVVSQFMHDPRERNLQAVNIIIPYLKATPGKELLFKKGKKLFMKIYTDVDYAGSIADKRSTTGYCMFLGGNLVTWRSKKQNVVARSSAEEEFRAMAQGVCELLWMKIILDDLKIKHEVAMGLACDNMFVINIAHNPFQHDRTKHVEIDRHFIKEKSDNSLIATKYIPSRLQLTDMFTKRLPTIQRSYLEAGNDRYTFTNLSGSVA